MGELHSGRINSTDHNICQTESPFAHMRRHEFRECPLAKVDMEIGRCRDEQGRGRRGHDLNFDKGARNEINRLDSTFQDRF